MSYGMMCPGGVCPRPSASSKSKMMCPGGVCPRPSASSKSPMSCPGGVCPRPGASSKSKTPKAKAASTGVKKAGTSAQAIKGTTMVKKNLKNGVKNGDLLQTKGSGASNTVKAATKPKKSPMKSVPKKKTDAVKKTAGSSTTKKVTVSIVKKRKTVATAKPAKGAAGGAAKPKTKAVKPKKAASK